MNEITDNLINITQFKEISNKYNWLQDSHIRIIYKSDIKEIVWSEGYKENRKYPTDDISFIISLKKSLNDEYICIYDYIELIEKYESLETYIHIITFECNDEKKKLTIDKDNLKVLKEQYNDCKILNVEWKSNFK